MNDHEFQLLMGRFTNQDESLARIEVKLNEVTTTVEKHDKQIYAARTLAWLGMTLTPIALGLAAWFKGGK